MTSRLKIITDMKELTTANDYKTNETNKTNETYIIKLKRDTDKLIDLYQNGDDKINTIERIKQFLKKNN
jgi:hypothetical protein